MIDPVPVVEQRKSGIRRDLNDIFRGDDGKISGSKIGTYAGQIIAGKLLLENARDLIDHWDSLAILFTVLIAPEIWKLLMRMKYGGGTEGSSTITDTNTNIQSRQVTK